MRQGARWRPSWPTRAVPCRAALPTRTGKFADVTSLAQLRDMPNWTAETPLRVVTGYHNIAKRFFASNGFRCGRRGAARERLRRRLHSHI